MKVSRGKRNSLIIQTKHSRNRLVFGRFRLAFERTSYGGTIVAGKLFLFTRTVQSK